MTLPPSQNLYGTAIGSGANAAPVFATHDPTTANTNYPIQQRWINTQTQAIWVLEKLVSSNGIVTAQWRSLAPIVLSSSDPSSGVAGVDYQYPLGQPWLNTTTKSYWILVGLSGTTPDWDQITSGGTGTVISLSDQSGTKTYANASGNIQIPQSGSITTTAGTNSISVELTGLTNHSVLVGAGTPTITKVGPPSDGQNSGVGYPLMGQGVGADPSFSTQFYINENNTVAFMQPTAADASGHTVQIQANNLDASSTSSHAVVAARSTTGGGGDAYFTAVRGGAFDWVLGISHVDNSFNLGHGGPPSALVGGPYLSVSTSGAITISATGSLTFGTGSPLSSYVENTFTPGISFNNGTTGITYSSQQGYYTRIGRVVFIQGIVALSNKGSDVGTARITGLPFAVKSGTNPVGTIGAIQNLALGAGYYFVTMQFLSTETAAALVESTANGTGSSSNMTDTNFANNTVIYFSGQYIV